MAANPAQRLHCREKTRAHFANRARAARLATAKIVAPDQELIEQAIAAGRVRRQHRVPPGKPAERP